MNTIRHHLLPLAFAGAATVACAAVATAQVPQNTAVFGTYSGPISTGTSGLFLLPMNGGAATTVGNLPIELQQATGPYQRGVGGVDLRSEDGGIVCGTIAAGNGPGMGGIHLFVLYLNGTTIDTAQTRKIYLGSTNTVGGSLVRVLPDGRILVLASDGGGALTTGPMANHLAAIVDISQPVATLTMLPNPAGSGVGGGFAVDPAGQFAYYLLSANPGSPTGLASLYRWELSTGSACTIASWIGHVAKGVSCGDDGTVYVATNNVVSITHEMHTVQPDGCASATVTSMPSSLPLPANSVHLDATGSFLIATAGWAPGFPNHRNSVASVDPATGAVTMLASPSAPGWGLMSDIAVRRPMVSYGPSSDGQNRYVFDSFPNPGGQPTIGNSSFSLTMRAAPNGALASVLGLSLGRGSLSALGCELLLDLNTIVATVTVGVAGATTATYSMPIPNNPNLVGFEFTAQSLHLESTGFATSRGLQVTIQ